ncbi:MAG: nucleoside-triphosphatase [Ignavibacteriaceae bacterium]|nr:nucleoside-triphosphatase [Ignavibacteriaceae bacterium]
MKNIYILTGKIQSGKTTKLVDWAANRTGVYGILSPVILGKKHLTDLKSGESKQLEVNDSERGGSIINIGHYRFDKDVFKWGRDRMLESIGYNPEWFIVDEIGPLEFRGEGLEPAFREILIRSELLYDTKLVLVIREGLTDSVLDHFRIPKSSIKEFTFE